jgi:SAM-dependent methyltransferase
MNPQPRLVDAPRLAKGRARARLDRAGFLHDEAKFELQERLIDVNRRFTAPAIVTPFPEIWADVVPGAKPVLPTDTLDLTPGDHDLVIHAMALHWADDPVGQIVQCRRALKPDGLFLGAAFGGETLTELRAVLADAEAQTLGGLSPRVAPMAEIRDMGGLLGRAGLALPVADRLPKTVTYANAFALMADLRDMGETNALADRHKVGVLLANLGTPDNYDYWSMRRYLNEFLSDRRVIDYSPWIWQPLLQLVILTKRRFQSGAAYKSIWNEEAAKAP